jgi:hypothetical protein
MGYFRMVMDANTPSLPPPYEATGNSELIALPRRSAWLSISARQWARSLAWIGSGILLIVLLSWILQYLLPDKIPPVFGPVPTDTPQAERIIEETPQFYLSPYIGKPAPIILEVGGQLQTAAIGTYTWIEKVRGDETTIIHSDAFALITPARPLKVFSPITANVRLPIPITPQMVLLTYIAPVGTQEIPVDGEWVRWDWEIQYENRQNYLQKNLLLTPNEYLFSIDLEPGIYGLEIRVKWDVLGEVHYGFLIEVLPPASTLPTRTPVPLLDPSGDAEVSSVMELYSQETIERKTKV